MHLENIVFDAVEPRRRGAFWEAALGCERLTDEPAGFETRLTVVDGPVLDLCFQPVPEPSAAGTRLRLGLAGGDGSVVERLLALGARRLDDPRGIDAPGPPEARLTDPEGAPFRVLGGGTAYAGSGPLAVLTLDSADPDRDVALWSWLTGWVAVDGAARSLRHASGLGPVLRLVAEAAPKGTAKNPIHLDVRLEPGDDAAAVAAGIAERGGRELAPAWGDLPWRVYADPSGNEFCVLPAPH